MKKILFLLLSALCLTTLAEKSVCLTKNGKPASAIILEAKPTRSAQMAAFEIQHAVKKMSGTVLPICYGKTPAKLLPIRIVSDDTRPIGGTFFSADADGVVIKGRDDKDFAEVNYKKASTFPGIDHTLKGTLDSAYDFLETACGVRYYALSDDECSYPKNKTIVIKSSSKSHLPVMQNERRFSCVIKNLRDKALLQLRWRNTLLTGGVNHNTWSIFFRYYGQAKGRFYGNVENVFIEKRPEYFANHKGKASLNHVSRLYPGDKDLPPQICFSHPGPVEYFAKEAVSAYRGIDMGAGIRFKPRRIEGVPYSYPVLEDDNKCFCECDNCKKIFAKIPQEQLHGYLHFDWLNRIARAARKQQPDIMIASCAYSKSIEYPKPEVLKLEDNLAVKICLAIDSWQHPGLYKWQHGIYKNWVKNEAARRPLSVWCYMLSPTFEAKRFYKYDDFFPMLRPWKIGDIFKEFVTDGIRGYYIEADFDTQLLEGYVLNKIAINGAQTDVDAILDEYFVRTYGKAAQAVKEFYLEIQKIVSDPASYPAETMKTFRKTSFAGGTIHTAEANSHLASAKNIQRLGELMAKARKLATTQQEKANVAKLDKKYYQMILTVAKKAKIRAILQKSPVPSLRAAKLAKNLNGDVSALKAEQVKFSGIWNTIEGNSKKNTNLRMGAAFDDEFFYLYFQDLKYQKPAEADSGIWRDNFEIFVSSSLEPPYGHLALSPRGEFASVRHDYPGEVPKVSEWNLKSSRFKSTVENGVWTAVFAVKISELIPDKIMQPGRRFYMNVMRTRRVTDGISSSWSLLLSGDYAANFHRMGKVYLR